MTRVVNSRLRLLLLCVLLAFGALLARAAWISTVRASTLAEMGQVQTKAPVILPAPRGTIFDSMGSPLALGEQATTVYADPHEVKSPATTARTAARILGLKPNAVYRALTVKGTHFSYVARKADPGIDNKGPSGLELQLNQALTGRPGQQTVVQDPFGQAISVTHTVPARPG